MSIPGEVVEPFGGGMNNIAQTDALPKGYTRELMNFDPLNGGSLAMRAGYSRVATVGNVRGGVPYGGKIVVVSDTVDVFNPGDGSLLRLDVAPAGSTVIGAELNGDCFLQVGVTQLRIRDGLIAPWAGHEAIVSVTMGTGSLPAGTYRVATTETDVFGAEGGTTPSIVTVGDNTSITMSWTGGPRNVYTSAPNGETLYFQTVAASTFTLSTVGIDSTSRLTTGNMQPPPVAEGIVADKARLFMHSGNAVWATEPFAPHLVDYINGYLLFDAPVTVVQPVDAGVYVCTASRTYFVEDFGTKDIEQKVVAEVGAVSGSGTILPDGSATWMSRFGQVRAANGAIEFPQRGVYAPIVATSASAGVVNNNGVEMIVTNQRGAAVNSLGVVDSFDLEIE